MARWRLILDGEASGPWNMGVDEALLATACSGGPPTLRLYRWRGPWLSLGYAQRLEPPRAAACCAAGVGVVGRVTGGRAVLHGGDLTYAVAAAESDLPPGLMASYELVSRALVDALRGFGVPAAPSPAPAGAQSSRSGEFDCFATPANREICAHGRKLAGSAQRRARGGVLQHGSIRLLPDPSAAARACSLVPNTATSLAELGVIAGFDAVAAACAEAFSVALGCRFEPGALTRSERSAAGSRRENPEPRPSPRLDESSRHPINGR